MPENTRSDRSAPGTPSSYDSRYKTLYNDESKSYDTSRFTRVRRRFAKNIKNDLIARLLEDHGLDSPSTQLLDVASGTGRISHSLLKSTSSRILSADISIGMLSQNKANLPAGMRSRASWSTVNMRSLPFPSNTFDAATLGSFLYLIPLEEYPRYLADIRRTLKPGGLLLCEVSNTLGIFNPKNTIAVLLHKYLRRRKVKSYVVPWHLRDLFSGFAIDGAFGVEYPLLTRNYERSRQLVHWAGRKPLLRHLGGKLLLVLRKA